MNTYGWRFLLMLGIAISACNPKRDPADLIISGKIYTGANSQPIVEAIAVRGDTIIFVGSNYAARNYKGEKTKVIDLQQNVMMPGFIEGHGHIMELGYNEMQLDLRNARSYEEIVNMVKDAVAKTSPGEWILGRGWHQDKWETKPPQMVNGFQTHQLLSEVSPDNPVFLSHASGHAAMANAKAMEVAGVNLLSKERIHTKIKGGEIIRDEFGNPTGIFSENAMALIEDHIPEKTAESDSKALHLAMQACLRNGITSFHDAGAKRSAVDLFFRYRDEQKLKVRLYVMLERNRQLINDWYKRGPFVDPTHWLTVRSIKLYTDGALGSRGAWLLEPYSDRPDYSGAPTLSMDTVLRMAREGVVHGFQICSHAIGDRANREVLDRYEIAFHEHPQESKDARYRIEHAQHLNPDDIPRFGRLGVIPAMQAIHMSSDRPWAINRLGEKRITEGAYVWQSLLKSGAHIVNGTDCPVEPINPIACFYASVTRKTLEGTPEGGYEPEQKMTRGQALRSYTLDAAYGAFEEGFKGSIEVGKLADFTVFSKDIMRVQEDSILTAEVVMTIIGGKILFEKK